MGGTEGQRERGGAGFLLSEEPHAGAQFYDPEITTPAKTELVAQPTELPGYPHSFLFLGNSFKFSFLVWLAEILTTV